MGLSLTLTVCLSLTRYRSGAAATPRDALCKPTGGCQGQPNPSPSPSPSPNPSPNPTPTPTSSQVAAKDKPSPIDRSYFHDTEGWLIRAIAAAAAPAAAAAAAAPTASTSAAAAAASTAVALGAALAAANGAACVVLPRMRVLRYTRPGGALPPHTDLPRAAPDVSPAARTTHTFLLYVGDCNGGGETLLLEALPGDERLALAGGLARGARGASPNPNPNPNPNPFPNPNPNPNPNRNPNPNPNPNANLTAHQGGQLPLWPVRLPGLGAVRPHRARVSVRVRVWVGVRV